MAQLDKALGYESGDWGFKSLQGHFCFVVFFWEVKGGQVKIIGTPTLRVSWLSLPIYTKSIGSLCKNIKKYVGAVRKSNPRPPAPEGVVKAID